jgi:hypothetical protein
MQKHGGVAQGFMIEGLIRSAGLNVAVQGQAYSMDGGFKKEIFVEMGFTMGKHPGDFSGDVVASVGALTVFQHDVPRF